MKRHLAAILLTLAVFAPAHARDPVQSPDALIQLALEAEDQGRVNDAIELHKAVVEAQPGNVRSLNSIAGLYGRLGNFQEEVNWAKRATGGNGEYEPALINLGNGYAGLGDTTQATLIYGVAITKNPKSAIGHYSLGVLHEQMGDVARAETNYTNAIDADAKFENAYFNLGALCANQGRLDEAAEWLQRLLKINPAAADAQSMLKQIRQSRPEH